MATQTNGGYASMVKGKVTAHGDIIQGGPSTYPYAPYNFQFITPVVGR